MTTLLKYNKPSDEMIEKYNDILGLESGKLASLGVDFIRYMHHGGDAPSHTYPVIAEKTNLESLQTDVCDIIKVIENNNHKIPYVNKEDWRWIYQKDGSSVISYESTFTINIYTLIAFHLLVTDDYDQTLFYMGKNIESILTKLKEITYPLESSEGYGSLCISNQDPAVKLQFELSKQNLIHESICISDKEKETCMKIMTDEMPCVDATDVLNHQGISSNGILIDKTTESTKKDKDYTVDIITEDNLKRKKTTPKGIPPYMREKHHNMGSVLEIKGTDKYDGEHTVLNTNGNGIPEYVRSQAFNNGDKIEMLTDDKTLKTLVIGDSGTSDSTIQTLPDYTEEDQSQRKWTDDQYQ